MSWEKLRFLGFWCKQNQFYGFMKMDCFVKSLDQFGENRIENEHRKLKLVKIRISGIINKKKLSCRRAAKSLYINKKKSIDSFCTFQRNVLFKRSLNLSTDSFAYGTPYVQFSSGFFLQNCRVS
ncbi:hypothetical protein Syun_011756 [Stephania yunnanensis]|uniref:Uncharacterized protein n=1 Tax=Stephania yunnanensis TaxID=152371 RepID=A0AAP0JY59_9MAGN